MPRTFRQTRVPPARLAQPRCKAFDRERQQHHADAARHRYHGRAVGVHGNGSRRNWAGVDGHRSTLEEA